jgi:hypothetical protein
MIKFKHYPSDSLGVRYVFGITLSDLKTQPTLDVIIGKHIFVILWKKYSD